MMLIILAKCASKVDTLRQVRRSFPRQSVKLAEKEPSRLQTQGSLQMTDAFNATLVVIQRLVKVRACLPLADRETPIMSAKLVLAADTRKQERSSLRLMCASHVQPADSERILPLPRQSQILPYARLA
jgi:hypothetical protein